MDNDLGNQILSEIRLLRSEISSVRAEMDRDLYRLNNRIDFLTALLRSDLSSLRAEMETHRSKPATNFYTEAHKKLEEMRRHYGAIGA